MKSRPLAPVSSASAISAGSMGAEGWPPIVLLQSSKSSACEAVPFTSAASSAFTRALSPKTSEEPPLAPRRRTPAGIRVVSSPAAGERDPDEIQDSDFRRLDGGGGERVIGERVRRGAQVPGPVWS